MREVLVDSLVVVQLLLREEEVPAVGRALARFQEISIHARFLLLGDCCSE